MRFTLSAAIFLLMTSTSIACPDIAKTAVYQHAESHFYLTIFAICSFNALLAIVYSRALWFVVVAAAPLCFWVHLHSICVFDYDVQLAAARDQACVVLVCASIGLLTVEYCWSWLRRT
jgi:hypothetical protein